MVWTNFTGLGAGPATPNELDANLLSLTYLAPVACTVAGTNALTLTPANPAAPLTAFQQNMQFTGIAAATNSTGATATVVGISGVLPIYNDTPTGPVALTGGEIVQLCAFTLRYDLALNGGGGGFHLQTGSSQFITQSISVAALIARNASISGVASIGTVNVAGGIATLSSLSVASLLGANASVSGIISAASISFAGLNALIRLNSTLASISQVTLTPFAFTQTTVALTGAAINDMIFVGEVGTLAFGSVSLRGYVAAAGSVIVSMQNNLNNATLTLTTISFRVSDFGFAA